MKKVLMIFFLTLLFSVGIFCQNDTINATLKNYNDFRDYIQHSIKYPRYAVENGLQGAIIFDFRVNKLGCIDSIIFRQSPHESFNKDIERVLHDTKCKWKPAQYKGVPIDIWLNSKVIYELQI